MWYVHVNLMGVSGAMGPFQSRARAIAWTVATLPIWADFTICPHDGPCEPNTVATPDWSTEDGTMVLTGLEV